MLSDGVRLPVKLRRSAFDESAFWMRESEIDVLPGQEIEILDVNYLVIGRACVEAVLPPVMHEKWKVPVRMVKFTDFIRRFS